MLAIVFVNSLVALLTIGTFPPFLNGESPKTARRAASGPSYRAEQGEDRIVALFGRATSRPPKQDGIVGSEDVAPVETVADHPRAFSALAVTGTFADGGVGRELSRGDSEPGGGKVAFPGGVLDFAPTRDRVAAYVDVALGGRPPRPETCPCRLLADASRNGLLLGDGRGEKAHLGFAIGAGIPSSVGEAAPVELCDPFVFACREKALERLRLRPRDKITPKVGARNICETLWPYSVG